MTQKKRPPKVARHSEGLHYAVEVRDAEGKLIQRIAAPARSYLGIWTKLLRGHMAGALTTVKDTGGTDRSSSGYSFDWNLRTGLDNQGPVVGSGTTAVTIDDYKLDTQITKGAGAGQLGHEVTQVDADPTITGPLAHYDVTRIFPNTSGDTVTVKEIGLYTRATNTPFYFCIVRDVLPASVDVPDGGSITVTYTISHSA
jgi:hypothetical protein